jgi:hypothetical protein
MAQGVVRLLFSLVGQDKLSSAIIKNQKQLDKFANSAEKSGKKSGKAFAAVSGVIDGLPGRIADVNAAFDLLGGAVDQVVATVDGLAEAEQRLSGQRVFRELAGGVEEAEAAMLQLQEATQGTISAEGVRTFANQMGLAGLSIEQTSETLRTAFAISDITGRELLDVAETLQDSLVTGSDTGFEFLGLTVDLNDALDKQAEAIGKTRYELSTSEKAQFRLAAMTEALEDRMVQLNLDTKQTQTTFQRFRTSVENAKDAVGEFAAESFGTTQQAEEIAATQNAINGLFKDFEAELNKNRADRFVGEVVRITGLAKDVVEGQALELLRLGVVNERRLHNFGKALIEIQNENRQKERDARKQEIADREAEDRKENADRLKKIEEYNKQIADLESQKNEAIRTENEAAEQDIDNTISAIQDNIRFVKGEITEVQLEAATARREAEEQARVQAALKSEFEEQTKKREDDAKKRADAAKRRADQRERDAQQDAQNLERIQDIRDQTRIDELKSQRQFQKAEQVALEKAQRNIIGSFAEFNAKRKTDQQLAQVELEEEQRRIRQEFAQLRTEDAAQLLEKQNEQRQLERDEIKRHEEEIAEFRRMHRENDIRQAEELSARSAALAGDLRRYNEETAIVMQGQADITSALAQNAGDVGRQASASIAAGGKMTEALIKDNKAAAATRAAFETAAGIAAFATGNVVGGTMHLTAAGLFATLAGTSKGKSTARTASRSLSRGGGGFVGGFGGEGTGNQINVNVAGFVTGTSKDLGVQVANTVQDVQSTGLSTGTV